jgi:UDP-N-acetylmuramate--alanine ligase
MALDVAARSVAAGASGSTFAARLPGGVELNVALPLHGVHNILNALAALGALYLVADGDETRLLAFAAALSEFPGVARRGELKGSRNGAAIIDDYAHHPTEVAAALAALSDPRKHRLIAVFQPHLYSRTKALAPRFGRALAAADEIVVLDVYPAREEPVGDLAGVSGRRVAEAAADHAGGRPVWWVGDLDSAERALKSRLGEGDVLVTLGAGDVYELADRLVESPIAPDAAGPRGGHGGTERR